MITTGRLVLRELLWDMLETTLPTPKWLQRFHSTVGTLASEQGAHLCVEPLSAAGISSAPHSASDESRLGRPDTSLDWPSIAPSHAPVWGRAVLLSHLARDWAPAPTPDILTRQLFCVTR